MRKTQLGSTDVEVSAIGLGAMHLSLAGRPPEDEAVSVVHRALEEGITFIDTADAYCRDEGDKHHNERLLRKALDTYEGETRRVVVATKGGSMRPDGQWTRNGRPEHLREAIRTSYEVLGGSRPIALWQHHAPDPEVPVEESLQAAREAVEEGLIRYVGVSNYSVEEIERAREVVDVVSVQNRYNPWHRKPESDGVLDYCTREGLTFLAYSPLGGRRRAKQIGDYKGIAELAREKDCSPHQLVLAWLMRTSCVLPIPGATRPESIADSARAVELALTEEEARRVSAAAEA